MRAAVAAIRGVAGFEGASLRSAANWWELIKFCLVGASGYVVNLAVFSLAVTHAGLHFRLAAVCAFVVAVTNNFVLNRNWTFSAGGVGYARQASRYLTVSTSCLGGNLLVLTVLVSLGAAPLAAQATAVALMTPISFVFNKLWSFRVGTR